MPGFRRGGSLLCAAGVVAAMALHPAPLQPSDDDYRFARAHAGAHAGVHAGDALGLKSEVELEAMFVDWGVDKLDERDHNKQTINNGALEKYPSVVGCKVSCATNAACVGGFYCINSLSSPERNKAGECWLSSGWNEEGVAVEPDSGCFKTLSFKKLLPLAWDKSAKFPPCKEDCGLGVTYVTRVVPCTNSIGEKQADSACEGKGLREDQQLCEPTMECPKPDR